MAIVIKNSQTASAAPGTSDLVTGELAINTNDGKLYMKDDANNIVLLAQNQTNLLPLSGGTMTGNTIHNDNVHSYYGTGNDLDIYHDGVDSRIHNNAGNLFIRDAVNSGLVAIQSNDSGGTTREGIIVGGATPDVKLYYDGVEAVRTSSGGINFSSNALAANTLDDYEEGTWTPSLHQGGVAGTTATTDRAVGAYTKVGNRVWLQFRILTTSLNSIPTGGSVSIGGLPFTASSVTDSHASGYVGFGQGLALTAGTTLTILIIPGTIEAPLSTWGVVLGTSSLLGSEWSADGGIIAEMSYYV